MTWTPGNGFYADLAYRQMDFDLDATFAGGEFTQDGEASGISLEVGYAFETASGWKIEPQLQYSSLSVDGLEPIGSGWGAFTYEDNDSARLRAGVSLRKTFETGRPQLDAVPVGQCGSRDGRQQRVRHRKQHLLR